MHEILFYSLSASIALFRLISHGSEHTQNINLHYLQEKWQWCLKKSFVFLKILKIYEIEEYFIFDGDSNFQRYLKTALQGVFNLFI